MERQCSRCGNPMISGALGTNKDPMLYWSQAQTQGSGRIRISTSSGPRLPVEAWRCESCGQLDLTAAAL
jgi:hypothetical protein